MANKNSRCCSDCESCLQTTIVLTYTDHRAEKQVEVERLGVSKIEHVGNSVKYFQGW